VIDGSRAMKAYMQPAYMAIKTSMETIESDQNNENKYKWGAVVYRDYAEQKCPDGDMLLEYTDLTNNGQEVVNFLSTEVIASDCMDNGGEQALYYGLSKALRMFGPYKEETNVVILIGGAGNREQDPQVDFNTLLNKVVETQASILAFQVMNRNGEATYVRFQDQLQDLIVKSSERIQSSYRKTYSEGKISKKILFKEKNSESYHLDFPVSSPLPGSIVWSPDGQSMEQDTLRDEILDIVRSLNNYNEELFAVADAKLKGMGKRYKINEGMLFFLSKMDVDPSLLDKSSDKNIQFFVEGYTCVKSSKLTEPLYNYCLFVDVSQLSDMIKILDQILDDNATNSELREYMGSAYKEILKSHYISSKESKKIMESKDLKQINELIFGLPSRSDLLKGFTIEDFSTMDEYKMKEVRTYFSQKRDELYSFLNNKENGFMSNDVLYYWVPQKLIP
ncbi:MAG: hypothetical protein IT223_01495, partial [Crocinitomicaceae bacterium]|nr:hypothetical protein [Crocinitomicaceae bacterium]